MISPGSTLWFARHEARLAWRDWLHMMTGGRRGRLPRVLAWFTVLAVFLHGLAYLLLAPAGDLAGPVDRHLLAAITGTLAASWSLMLSQALESVTRAFYARGDLDLILTSPVQASRLFAVRIGAMALTIMVMTMVLGAPFLNMLALLGGARWLAGYGVALALAMSAVAVATGLTVALFRLIGPRRTRAISQVLSAVIGAAFAIGVQVIAVMSYGSITQTPVARTGLFEDLAPDLASPLWWPARAVVDGGAALPGMLVIGAALLAAAIWVFAPRFGRLALSTANVTQPGAGGRGRRSRFNAASPAAALRRKEWVLLLRDPWLMSQSLMQLLYLLPGGLILYGGFHGAIGTVTLLVPVLILGGGQLAGGLAWLAVSGEDAPELIATAPVPAARVLRAKTEAVIGAILIVFSPFLIVLAVLTPVPALVAAVGIVIAAGTSTAIQYWFRTRGRRSQFRRRQTASRVATFAEALASTGWAGTGALAAAGTWLTVVPLVLVLGIIAGAWMLSPERRDEEN